MPPPSAMSTGSVGRFAIPFWPRLLLQVVLIALVLAVVLPLPGAGA